jgi:hypothetical protein
MVELEDPRPLKVSKTRIAELSRPDRAQNEYIRQKRKENENRGQPRFKESRPAVYHNWFSPFLWNQILAAGKAVGWEMSSSEIRNWLRRKHPETFGSISRTTINEWIDRSGPRPKWSEKALKMAENGNHQRNPNGGRRGALVSS